MEPHGKEDCEMTVIVLYVGIELLLLGGLLLVFGWRMMIRMLDADEDNFEEDGE